MIFFIFAMTISPSTYFTYGDISKETKGYSIATYWTIEYDKNYFLFAYNHYLENGQSDNLRQQLFSVGYTKEILPRVGIRATSFYLFTSNNDIGGTLSARLFYGYNPVLSLGYTASTYSKQFQNSRRFYNTFQLNPECRYYLFNKFPITVGLYYTKTPNENYLAYSGSFGFNPFTKLNLSIGGIYGSVFYYTDDRLLIVNNRPNLQKGGLSVNAKCSLIKNLRVALILQKDIYRTYNVNYYGLGIEINEF